MAIRRGGALLRSFPGLVALLLALFTPWGAAASHRYAVGDPAAARPVVASSAVSERLDRTSAASVAGTRANAAAEPLPAAPSVPDRVLGVADRLPDRVRALVAQHAAGAAGSRAPPFAG